MFYNKYIMKALVFPGQGSQFVGMGRDLYDNNEQAHALFEQANSILGFRITDIMFSGTDEELRQTRVTQPAVFLHSVISALCSGVKADMMAGHSLGELSALTASGCLSFEDGLRLVYARAMAMQACCEAQPGSMAAVLRLPDETVSEVCAEVSAGGSLGIVLPVNFNCPGQVVISGNEAAVNEACERLMAAGARRCLPLAVSGAYHSPLMKAASQALASAIEAAEFKAPCCLVYQNVDGQPTSDPRLIRAKLLQQMTSPVQWTSTVKNMIADGCDEFIECGPGTVLTGLIAKIR